VQYIHARTTWFAVVDSKLIVIPETQFADLDDQFAPLGSLKLIQSSILYQKPIRSPFTDLDDQFAPLGSLKLIQSSKKKIGAFMHPLGLAVIYTYTIVICIFKFITYVLHI
jgi:hypothetical protein